MLPLSPRAGAAVIFCADRVGVVSLQVNITTSYIALLQVDDCEAARADFNANLLGKDGRMTGCWDHYFVAIPTYDSLARCTAANADFARILTRTFDSCLESGIVHDRFFPTFRDQAICNQSTAQLNAWLEAHPRAAEQ